MAGMLTQESYKITFVMKNIRTEINCQVFESRVREPNKNKTSAVSSTQLPVQRLFRPRAY